MSQDKPVKVTFIHTAEVLIDVFAALIKKYQLNITAEHVLYSELLQDAIAQGMTDELSNRIKAVCLKHARNSDLVVCTCSSLGEVAENITLDNGSQVIRIDRAMANAAVHSGQKICPFISFSL